MIINHAKRRQTLLLIQATAVFNWPHPFVMIICVLVNHGRVAMICFHFPLIGHKQFATDVFIGLCVIEHIIRYRDAPNIHDGAYYTNIKDANYVSNQLQNIQFHSALLT
jgi:hypothetical protein